MRREKRVELTVIQRWPGHLVNTRNWLFQTVQKVAGGFRPYLRQTLRRFLCCHEADSLIGSGGRYFQHIFTSGTNAHPNGCLQRVEVWP